MIEYNIIGKLAEPHGIDFLWLGACRLFLFTMNRRTGSVGVRIPSFVSLHDACTRAAARHENSLSARNGSVTVLIRSVSASDRGQARGDVRWDGEPVTVQSSAVERGRWRRGISPPCCRGAAPVLTRRASCGSVWRVPKRAHTAAQPAWLRRSGNATSSIGWLTGTRCRASRSNTGSR